MKEYNITRPLIMQTVLIVITSLVLDHGVMFNACLAGNLVYWIFFAIKLFRKSPPDRIDLFLLRYGYLIFGGIFYYLPVSV
jgi:hypothetical protein